MTTPSSPPPGTDGVEHSAPDRERRSHRFFTWVQGLGIVRGDGWVGGVAAGIAERLRIDPLIVRGILVVGALFALPLIPVYAVAWALLPDVTGRIHLRELLRGHFEPAQVGILAGLVIGMLAPSGLFLLGGAFRPDLYGPPGPLSVLLVLLLLTAAGILLALIVRAARRTPGGEVRSRKASADAPAPRYPSATDGNSGASAAEILGEGADTEGALLASSPHSEPGDALTSWRDRRSAWREQDENWRAMQQDPEQWARTLARAERHAASAAFAAEASERRRLRRAANPRASAAYLALVAGVAVIAGAVVWLAAARPDATTGGMALFTASLVLALGMVISGVARRRSGFLAFLTVATLTVGLITATAASLGDVRFGSVTMNNIGDARVRQPFGDTFVYLQNIDGARSQPVVLDKGDGLTEIYVSAGVTLELSVILGDGVVQVQSLDPVTGEAASREIVGTRRAEGTTSYRETISSPIDPAGPEASQTVVSVPVTIRQDSGFVLVNYTAASDEKEAE